MQEKLNSNHFLYRVFFLFLVLVCLLSRTATGIYLFNFRLGEYAVAIAVLFSILSIFIKQSAFSEKKPFFSFKSFMILLYLSFLISLLINLDSDLSTYIFRSSSYLWFIVFFLVGLVSYDYGFPLSKFYKFCSVLLIFLYFYLTLELFKTDQVSNFFLQYSDKFELHKGSDLGIIYILTMYMNNKLFSYRFKFEYFIYSSALLLPLFLFVSRAAFISTFAFFLYELYLYVKVNENKYSKIFIQLILFTIIFFTSVNFVQNKEIISDTPYYENLIDLTRERNTIQYDSETGNNLFWVSNGRLYSADGNLNWRFQIWQDVIYDLDESNSLLFGYGYDDIIPAMNFEFRMGTDGLNEQVHNFLINILSRGGLFQLIIYLCFMQAILYFYYSKYKKLDILLYFLPICFISFFDSSMENAHFPILFYFFLGIIYRNSFSEN